MTQLIGMDRQLHSLQDEVIHEYKENIKKIHDISKQLEKTQPDRQKQIREIVGVSQINLDRLADTAEADLQSFLRKVRPPLVEYPTQRMADTKNLARSISLQSQHQKVATPYAATLLSADAANLEANSGERGDVWVNPSNPDQIKLRAFQKGKSWGCNAGPVEGENASVMFWFTFIPDVYSIWKLRATIALHGFYIVRVGNNIFDCDDGGIRIDGTVDAWQDNNWHGQNHYPLINLGGENTFVNSRYDAPGNFNYQVPLGAGDPVWVAVTISLNAPARGGGSYCELNFFNGNANYIQPLILTASPST